ncbi:MAG: hypothetical protein WCJ58_08070 [bacterium]
MGLPIPVALSGQTAASRAEAAVELPPTQRSEVEIFLAGIDATAQLASDTNNPALMTQAIKELPQIALKLEAARLESSYQDTEEAMDVLGTRFNADINASTAHVDWTELPGVPSDEIVNIRDVADKIDLGSVPVPVRNGINSVLKLEADQQEADFQVKNYDLALSVRQEAKANREITTANWKKFGYFLKYCGLPLAAFALGGVGLFASLPLSVMLSSGGGGLLAAMSGSGLLGLGSSITGIVQFGRMRRNEEFQKLTDTQIESRKKIASEHKGQAGIRKDAVLDNMQLIANISKMYEELVAMSILPRGVKNDDRIRGSFSQAAGFGPNITDIISLARGARVNRAAA